jgi:hypothetical protein
MIWEWCQPGLLFRKLFRCFLNLNMAVVVNDSDGTSPISLRPQFSNAPREPRVPQLPSGFEGEEGYQAVGRTIATVPFYNTLQKFPNTIVGFRISPSTPVQEDPLHGLLTFACWPEVSGRPLQVRNFL